jgi:hypothetical protein
MAQRMKIELISDLDGGHADETVHFGIDGTNYQIDLSTADARALRKVLEQYAKAGRKLPASTSKGGKASASASATIKRDTARKVREWAKDNGYSISARGRVPAGIIEAYQQAAA